MRRLVRVKALPPQPFDQRAHAGLGNERDPGPLVGRHLAEPRQHVVHARHAGGRQRAGRAFDSRQRAGERSGAVHARRFGRGGARHVGGVESGVAASRAAVSDVLPRGAASRDVLSRGAFARGVFARGAFGRGGGVSRGGVARADVSCADVSLGSLTRRSPRPPTTAGRGRSAPFRRTSAPDAMTARATGKWRPPGMDRRSSRRPNHRHSRRRR